MTILNQCLSLPLGQQIRIADALQRNISRITESEAQRRMMLPRWERYYKTILDINGWSELPTRSRRNDHFAARVCIAYQLRKDGYTLDAIGKMMHRDHSSISHYIMLMEFIMVHPEQFTLLSDMWKKFECSNNENTDE